MRICSNSVRNEANGVNILENNRIDDKYSPRANPGGRPRALSLKNRDKYPKRTLDSRKRTLNLENRVFKISNTRNPIPTEYPKPDTRNQIPETCYPKLRSGQQPRTCTRLPRPCTAWCAGPAPATPPTRSRERLLD